MAGRYLQITYGDGRPLAAYLRLSRHADAKATRTEEAGDGLIVDYDADGTPLGLEIVNPEIVSGEQINAVLSSLGVPAMSPRELSPLPAS